MVFMSFDDFFCLCVTNHFVFVLVAKKIAKSLYCCAGVVNIFLCVEFGDCKIWLCGLY